MADNYQQILGQALGGQFDAASFYRAKAKGFSDKDIVAAINASPGSATGQMRFIAQNYEKALSQTSPSKIRGGKYSAGDQEWGPQLMVTPNKYNPLLGGRDPYGGRFATSTEGDDPGQTFAKRGMSFSYGPQNAQEYLNQQYWAGQVNTNPEVSYRWHTGDSLDPESDIDNQYGRLAQMSLSGQEGSKEFVDLARQRADAYEKQGALGINKWSTGLHESDPRFARIAQDPAEYAKYLTETSPSKGSSEAARWIERALAGEVMTPAGGAQPAATTKTGPTQARATTPLAGREFENVRAAYKNIRKTGQPLSVEDVRLLSKKTGSDFFDTVKSLRARRDKAGETGAVLTEEARQEFRRIRDERKQNEGEIGSSFGSASPSFANRQEEPEQINVEKGRLASQLAKKAKAQRQEKKPNSISEPKPAPEGMVIAPRGTSNKVPRKKQPTFG